MDERRLSTRPTMRDVADRVGLSIKSVSRVLNGDPGVSEAKAEHVLAVARELGFRRNDLARSLRLQDRTETIGVVVRQASTRFYDSLIRGIDEVAARHSALVLTATTQSAEREQSAVLALSSRRVDGLIIVPSGEDQSYLRAEAAARMPMVFVDRPARGISSDTVVADNVAGGYAATQHLIARGHQRIGVIGTRSSASTMSERARGYRDACREAGLASEDLVRWNAHGQEGAQQACEELLGLAHPPTALFALNNVCTIGAVRALQSAQLSRQVALIGFDDFDTADLLNPPVTVITQDVEEMGRQAAEAIFSRIAGRPTTSRREKTVLPTTLIARGSGEIEPGRPATQRIGA